MYAIIRTGSKQYRVKKGDIIHVELLKQQPGEQVEFNDVLFVQDSNGQTKVGVPKVAGSKVKAEFLQVVKGPKIHSVKFKRRKNNVRKFGHRQKYSQVKIVDIVG